METVLITGGTGLIGHPLRSRLLEKGYRVIVLTRNKSKQKSESPAVSFAEWNVSGEYIDAGALAVADYIIHLAGASVAEKRWTPKRKQEIIDSRVKSSALLVKALKENQNKIKAVISASAIGWYGPDASENTQSFSEEVKPNNDFLGITCKQWEESIQPVETIGKRLVKLRIGIVLSNGGGAIREFKRPLHFGLATILGSGKQVVSWIHEDDLVNIFLFAMENSSVNGIYNAVAPHPVSNKELILQLAKQSQRFYIPVPVPSFVLKIVLGEMSIEVLKSATVSSKKIEAAGFKFQYPDIESAIRRLVAS